MIIISNLHSGTKLSGWLRHCLHNPVVDTKTNKLTTSVFGKFIIIANTQI